MKMIICREAGFDCGHVIKGKSEAEVMKNGIEHVVKEHGFKEEDISAEFEEKVKALIHTS
jgi:predicted small metal-binding protein